MSVGQKLNHITRNNTGTYSSFLGSIYESISSNNKDAFTFMRAKKMKIILIIRASRSAKNEATLKLIKLNNADPFRV